MVLGALAVLLMAALLIMFSYSRKAVKEEVLQEGAQTLEATMLNIDNVFLSVEQSVGNIYWKIINHADQPDKIEEYRRRLVENNRFIADCTIVMNADSSTMSTITPRWIAPQQDDSIRNGGVTSFYLPIYIGEKAVGFLRADVSLSMLSKIVLEAKPSPNSYCTLLGENGSYIVHPDGRKLNHNVFEWHKEGYDPSVKEAAQAMVDGETGYKYVSMDGNDYYVFYKPYERAEVPGRIMTNLGWSAGIVYPEDDIFGEYNNLLYMELLISIVGLLLLLLFCQTFIQHQLLPLRMLSRSAQRISEGHYDQLIPASTQHDEVGRLQNHFLEMQQRLAKHVGEMEQLTETLKERGEVLQAAYEQAEIADRMKTNFLYNMSNQIITPINGIYSNVMFISEHFEELTEEKTNQLVDEIHLRGERITDLLDQLITESERCAT